MMKDMSMHIMDIIQNSIKARATLISAEVLEDTVSDIFALTIIDNGCGMTPEILAAVRNPFTTSRTTRRVGLGIPMLEQTCVQCEGGLEIVSASGEGTTLKAVMKHSNIDRPPMGDMAGTLLALIVTNENEDFDITYKHKMNGKEFTFNSAEIKAALDGVPMSEPSVMEWLDGFIKEGFAILRN